MVAWLIQWLPLAAFIVLGTACVVMLEYQRLYRDYKALVEQFNTLSHAYNTLYNAYQEGLRGQGASPQKGPSQRELEGEKGFPYYGADGADDAYWENMGGF